MKWNRWFTVAAVAWVLSLLLLAVDACAAKLSWTIENAAGEPQDGLVLQLKLVADGSVVASTASGTIVDNGDGSYVTSGDLVSGEYSVYSGSGSGTLVPALAGLAHVDPDDLTAVRPIAQGGTNSATASGARTNLGLAIGTNVQAWTTDLDLWNTMSAAARGGTIHYWPYFNTDTNAWTAVSAAEHRDRAGLEIGADVQAWDADLTTLGAGGAGARANLGLAIGTNVQAWATELDQLAAAPAAVSGQDAFIVNEDGAGITAVLPAQARANLGLTDSDASRQLLGVEIGADVQAYSSKLTTLAANIADTPEDPAFLVVNGAGVTPEIVSASSARTHLGLGTAAVLDVAATGAASKVPQYTSDGALVIPTRTSHLAANAGNVGKMYMYTTGGVSTGTWGLYIIERDSNTIAYTYAVRAIVEQTW